MSAPACPRRWRSCSTAVAGSSTPVNTTTSSGRTSPRAIGGASPRQLGIPPSHGRYCIAWRSRETADSRACTATSDRISSPALLTDLLTAALDRIRQRWTFSRNCGSVRRVVDCSGPSELDYGSEGWGFECLRARNAKPRSSRWLSWALVYPRTYWETGSVARVHR